MRAIDADALERDGWRMTRIVQIDEKTMELQTRKPMEFPTVEPERIRGRWEIYIISMLAGEGCKCSECGFEGVPYWNFCPNCGADMREDQ